MVREEEFKSQWMLNKAGFTLIELLVVLIIFGVAIGAIYRVFIAQTKAYTVQDQVVEVQQNTRGAMEIIERDLRMAGFHTSTYSSALITNTPIVPDPSDNTHVTVNYQYVGAANTTYTVDYRTVTVVSPLCPNPPCLQHTCTATPSVAACNGTADILLTNVASLGFSYGIDANGDGKIDDQNGDGIINEQDFVLAANVGTANVFAVRVVLTVLPAPVNTDITTMVTTRTLDSTVTLRNIYFRNFAQY
jgi:prepilin-type N-terminal cleavage/methylation domain-containing protein